MNDEPPSIRKIPSINHIMDLVLHDKRQRDLCFVHVDMLVTHFFIGLCSEGTGVEIQRPARLAQEATPMRHVA